MTAQTRRRRSGITLDPDELRYATDPATAPAGPDKAAKKRPEPKTPAAPRRTKKPADPPASKDIPINPDALEGEAYPGEPRMKIGIVLPEHLKGQVDGAVRYAQDTGAVPGIDTITDFFRVACHRLVMDLQREHNGGDEFKPPRMNRRGRAPGR